MTEYGCDPGPLPERWLQCPRKASDLIENLFLAFKTPLDERFNEQVPIQFRFTPDLLFQLVKSNRQKLGLWVDLTKTNRFYDKKIVEANQCKYIKLECDGHDGPPNAEQTKTFVELCKLFVSKEPLSSIGVHCTHGFNRTGFMIVSYLVECYDYSVDIAIKYFARVRPPGIYKDKYIRELYNRYDDAAAPPAPPLPEWCFEENLNDSIPTNNKNGNRKRRSTYLKKNPTFMEGVPGVTPITNYNEVTAIRRKVQQLVGQNPDKESFIGLQPVSMDRNNIEFLAEKPYRVSWKADGTRYMMFIEKKDEVYFIDRDNSIFKVDNLQFFHRKCKNQHLTRTLLDGEMVIDMVNNTAIPRYLVYDIIRFEGNDVGKEPFYPTRLLVIEKEIIEPRKEAMKEGRIIREGEPCSIRAKDFFELYQADYLLSEKFARKLTHAIDGLIFQPSDNPYTFGTSSEVLKWKPESMNSIDFRLRVHRVENVGCLPEYIGDLLTGSGRIFGKIKCDKKLKELNDKIIECKLEGRRWVFMRERTDKSFANSDRTAESVYESICSPVTQSMLLEFIKRIHLMPHPMGSPPTKRARTN